MALLSQETCIANCSACERFRSAKGKMACRTATGDVELSSPRPSVKVDKLFGVQISRTGTDANGKTFTCLFRPRVK